MTATRLNPRPDYSQTAQTVVNPASTGADVTFTATKPALLYVSTAPYDTARNVVLLVNDVVACYPGGFDYGARDSRTLVSSMVFVKAGDVVTVRGAQTVYFNEVPLA